MAIQVLNVSVYPELLQWYRTDNPSNLVNEMDSIVEYVTEIVFGHKDAFPEYAHKHHKDLQVQLSLLITEPDQYYYQYYSEVNPPPPKA